MLTQTGTIGSFGMSKGGASGKTGDRLASFAGGEALKPFISKELLSGIKNPIVFRSLAGRVSYGYEATILVDLCDAVLAARQAGALRKQQLHIAERCEILMRGFAKVGIIALIDEATGYQSDRPDDELRRLLSLYVEEAAQPWRKVFIDEFYEQLARLWDLSWKPGSSEKPLAFAKLTEILIYGQLPPGVLEELRSKNPIAYDTGGRRRKHHQHLTPDVGLKHLQHQLDLVTTLMRVSSNLQQFKELFRRSRPGADHQRLFFDV
ncbi:P63C domain-containing protein [Singulisphaera sp. PoT]|uniref:P63C domain-containing protein n=1 Tax=Singulisphaera sp. PoT TaxID=3411797 RepID=UPI003BF5150C